MAGMAFSIITTGVFMYPLISGLIKPNAAKATVVAITLGSTGIKDNDGNMGGNIPNVAVYAEDGTEIGRQLGSNKKNWAAGTTNFVSINPNPGMDGRQATYVSLASGGNDGICISAISVAWPDSSSPKVWLGDMGANCSSATGPWFQYSVTQTGSDPEFQSKCIWIDSDATNGITTQGLSLHIVDFGRTNGAYTRDGEQTKNPVADQWNDNNDLLCKAPARMNFYNDFRPGDYPLVYQPPLAYNDNGTDMDINAVLNGGCDDDPELIFSPCATSRTSRKYKRTSQSRRSSNDTTSMTNTLIHSSNKAHSAEELCDHPGSVGPSIVSHFEDKFCDMTTRIIWPLCSDTISLGCFDSDSNKLVLDQKRMNNTHMDLVSAGRNEAFPRVVYW